MNFLHEHMKKLDKLIWANLACGEVLTLQRGFDLPEADRRPGRFPVIASTGQVGTHDEAMVLGPGVVIGRSGSLGGVKFIEDDFWPLKHNALGQGFPWQ